MIRCILQKFRDWYTNEEYLQSIEQHSITGEHHSWAITRVWLIGLDLFEWYLLPFSNAEFFCKFWIIFETSVAYKDFICSMHDINSPVTLL